MTILQSLLSLDDISLNEASSIPFMKFLFSAISAFNLERVSEHSLLLAETSVICPFMKSFDFSIAISFDLVASSVIFSLAEDSRTSFFSLRSSIALGLDTDAEHPDNIKIRQKEIDLLHLVMLNPLLNVKHSKYMHNLSEILKDLTIIIPVFNEASTICNVIDRLKTLFPGAELIAVNNASTDGSLNLLNSMGIIVINEPKKGKGNAMRSGIRHASRKWIMFQDADLEYKIEDMVSLSLLAIKSSKCTIGIRQVTIGQIRVDSYLANWVIKNILKLRFGNSPSDVLTGARVLPSSLLKEEPLNSSGFEIETEISKMLLKNKVEWEEHPVGYCPRTKHEGKKISILDFPRLIIKAIS